MLTTINSQPTVRASKEWTLNIAQAAGTYDITTATGDVLVEKYYVYVSTVGATLTSAAIQTDDTTAFVLLSAVEGAVANLVAGSNINPANKDKTFRLSNGKKLRFTLVGATGTGELRLGIIYSQITAGATLS